VAGAKNDDRYLFLVEELKAARLRLGLSQTALAARLGRRQQYVSKYEQCERRLDVVEFVDAARALQLDWTVLLRNAD
jgi:transcriptional regulator with XRE-family HTH domain